jgi:S-adenosylmethionine:tRNA ribosyltransferase-isomerase
MESLNLSDYTYELPDERIARYPLRERDQSKMLVYQHGTIRHLKFFELPEVLPDNSLLFFNDTKVIPARLVFHKSSGARIEVLLLDPVSPSRMTSLVMTARGSCSWECTIGNQKRWSEGLLLESKAGDHQLNAELIDRDKGIVKFTWSSDESFASLLALTGVTPLPPYLGREAEKEDSDRYQTVYSRYEGAVAAPTAGLHFTKDVLKRLEQKQIQADFLTLHVSAGTFLPVKEQNAVLHTMHSEQVTVTRETIANLLKSDRLVIPVGTTSMRTLESLYWYGVRLIRKKDTDFVISQQDPYQETTNLPSPAEAIQSIAGFMDDLRLDSLQGKTSIYILPGYKFRICKGLITNFHQPGSTLLLLIAAFVGNNWKVIYHDALVNDYRFLSYGDCSLLLP